MAQVFHINDYKKKTKRLNKKSQFLALLQLICFFASVFTYGLTLIPMIVIMIWSSRIDGKSHNMWQFTSGREESEEALEDLPDTYTVLHNVEIMNNKHVLHLNHVVIGPNGLFVVKAKNWAALKVVGEANDPNWTLFNKRNEYSEKNPVKQVKTQVHFLSEFLKKQNIGAWVQGIVYLSNRASSYEIDLEKVSEGSNIPVFMTDMSGEVHLFDYITEYKSKNKFTEEQQKEIIKILKNKK